MFFQRRRSAWTAACILTRREFIWHERKGNLQNFCHMSFSAKLCIMPMRDRNPFNESILTSIGFYRTLKTGHIYFSDFSKNLSRCRILWFLSVFSITILRIERMHVSGNLEVNARTQGKWIGNSRVAIHVTWLAAIFHRNFSRDRSKVKMATNGQRNDMYALGAVESHQWVSTIKHKSSIKSHMGISLKCRHHYKNKFHFVWMCDYIS